MEDNQPKEISIPTFEDACNGLDPEDITEAMDLIMDGFHLDMPYQKVEYFKTNRKVIKNDDGTFKKLTKGKKKGVFLAFVDPLAEENVCIGYSMCHPNDKFDYQRGYRFKGLGLWHAVRKAEKYKDSHTFRISKTSADKQLPKEIVKIPQSMGKGLVNFIDRCRSYYKDKNLPPWAEKFSVVEEFIERKDDILKLRENTED